MYAELKTGSGKQAGGHPRWAFVRLFKDLIKDPEIGQPVRPDHPGRGAHLRPGRDLPDGEDLLPRTGQTYDDGRGPQAFCCPTRNPRRGQILHEGISEAGAVGSLVAAGDGLRPRTAST